MIAQYPCFDKRSRAVRSGMGGPTRKDRPETPLFGQSVIAHSIPRTSRSACPQCRTWRFCIGAQWPPVRNPAAMDQRALPCVPGPTWHACVRFYRSPRNGPEGRAGPRPPHPSTEFFSRPMPRVCSRQRRPRESACHLSTPTDRCQRVSRWRIGELHPVVRRQMPPPAESLEPLAQSPDRERQLPVARVSRVRWLCQGPRRTRVSGAGAVSWPSVSGNRSRQTRWSGSCTAAPRDTGRGSAVQLPNQRSREFPDSVCLAASRRFAQSRGIGLAEGRPVRRITEDGLASTGCRGAARIPEAGHKD